MLTGATACPVAFAWSILRWAQLWRWRCFAPSTAAQAQNELGFGECGRSVHFRAVGPGTPERGLTIESKAKEEMLRYSKLRTVPLPSFMGYSNTPFYILSPPGFSRANSNNANLGGTWGNIDGCSWGTRDESSVHAACGKRCGAELQNCRIG